MEAPKIIKSVKEMLADMNLEKHQKHPHFHILNVADHLDEISNYSNIISEEVFEVNYGALYDIEMSVDKRKYEAKEGHLSFLSPGQSFYMDIQNSESLDIKGYAYLILFSVEFLDFFGPSNYSLIKKFPFFNKHYSPVYYTKGDLEELFLKYFKIIYDEFQNMDENNFEIIRSYLIILLYEINRNLNRENLENRKSSRAEEITFLFENLVKNTKNKRQKIAFYADKLNISSVYLSDCIKKITGHPPKKVITEYLIMEAKAQLEKTNDTIEKVAFDLGFNESSNFVLFFKKNVGVSPSKYRKK
jgi:AraC-like DNA-binding protein